MQRLGIVVVAGALVAGCGGGGEDPLRVGAAASLREALRGCAAGAALSFAGSDAIAAQVRQRLPLDVFAAANTELPEQLHAEGLVQRPVVFATNELVLVVPRGGRVRRVADLRDTGVTLAVGAEGVPVGAYTRVVLRRLGVRARVRSREPDVTGVVGKVAQGAVDAGFVYRTDVRAAGRRLRAIALPARVRPRVAYAAAVVRAGRHEEEARRYVAGLRRGPCAAALRRAGFGPA